MEQILLNLIEKMFIENELEESMLYAFFWDCYEEDRLQAFYIDDRVPFRHKNALYKLIDKLDEARNC